MVESVYQFSSCSEDPSKACTSNHLIEANS